MPVGHKRLLIPVAILLSRVGVTAASLGKYLVVRIRTERCEVGPDRGLEIIKVGLGHRRIPLRNKGAGQRIQKLLRKPIHSGYHDRLSHAAPRTVSHTAANVAASTTTAASRPIPSSSPSSSR